MGDYGRGAHKSLSGSLEKGDDSLRKLRVEKPGES